jgi:PAS domain S-box-containing protein
MTDSDVATSSSLPLRVLVLEDRHEDAELIIHELRQSRIEPAWERLETEAEYLERLQSQPDVILADYRMPQLDAARALELLQALELDIPFIVVSGTTGEDAAVTIMRQGATDYVLKDRLKHLGTAVRRALEEKQMREDKRKAEQALRASEARFYSFMNHTPVLAFIKDSDGRIIYINNTCEQAGNMTLADCQGKLDQELWPADEAARMRANDLPVLDGGEPTSLTEELFTPDGRILNMLSFRFPFADAAGCRLIGVVSVDITERMQTEKALAAAVAAKEALLQEVHHRVKNNLQIISSLLSLQFDSLSEPGSRQGMLEAQRRVQSMAMIHERLQNQEEMDHLDFGEYISALTRELFIAYGVDSNRVRLHLDLEPVSLELNQGIPCGLILNELVSNSLKHGFPGSRQGEIQVALSRDSDGRVALRVSDDGIGLPPGFEWSKSQSLGLRIVSILTRQLKGSIQQEAITGAGFLVAFPKMTTRYPAHPPVQAASRTGDK